MIRRTLIFFSIAVVAVVASVLVVRATRQKSVAKSWDIESPHKTYRIHFTGTPAKTSWPFTESSDVTNRTVVADIIKDGVPFIQSSSLYEGDAYDFSFDDLYPDSEWISEDILHLWDKKDSQKVAAISEEILISNESAQGVKYVQIKAGKTNLFLLFDLGPGARITLPIRLQHSEEVIGCEGTIDNQALPYRSGDFSLSTAGKAGTRYKVRLDPAGCSVAREE